MHKIGVLDSGIGGLTTCSAIIHKVKNLEIYYYADNKNAPYGTKTENEVLDFVFHGVGFLISNDVEIIVIACNTATAVAIGKLRDKYKIKFIGMEPALKPALSAGGRTLLLATPLTLKSNKIVLVIESKKFDIVTADTSSLAFLIEKSAPDFNGFDDLTYKIISPYKNINNVVLGCSHYSFLRPYISKNFPDINIFDGNTGVAEQVKKYTENNGITNFDFNIFFKFSGENETEKYQKCLKQLLNF